MRMASQKGKAIVGYEAEHIEHEDIIGDVQGSASKNAEYTSVEQGLSGISLGLAETEEEDNCSDGGDMADGSDDEEPVMDPDGDLRYNNVSPSEVKMMKFGSVEAAFKFYNLYGKVNGFSVRKHKVGWNNGEKAWQIFVCHRHGFRDQKYLNMPERKRDHRPITRCGCSARMRVRLDVSIGQWVVSSFNDEHNHELLGEKFNGFLPSHRKMTDADVAQFMSMRNSGISTPKIFGSFAHQSGGFKNIGFGKKELYNQIEKQRKLHDGDVKGAFKYLRDLQSTDPMMFWQYKLGSDGKLLHLFWCDGSSQIDYGVFGDALAFDATYRRNKYNCPLVVFSGVNHHKSTCVFASALVSDEKEDTYVWLLQQFLKAMKGKYPKCVITDGDCAMKNAIQIVFPEAHHRLCARHLLRNATANVGVPRFTELFQDCMLGDYEIEEFESKWTSMVENCGVRNHKWVKDLYEKRNMWATAYIRGNFFAGLRTTSRCEGLHALVGKFVGVGYNMTEFLKHFQRCLEYVRHNEDEADFRSQYGDPVLQTPLRGLEKFGAKLYTRAVFLMYRELLVKSSTIKIIGYRETSSSIIYIVSKYQMPDLIWHVSYYPQDMQILCSCLRMESFGIPCVHIIACLVFLDIGELPNCLILPRWTKAAKEDFPMGTSQVGQKTLTFSRYGVLVHTARELCNLGSKNEADFHDVRAKLAQHTAKLKLKQQQHLASVNQTPECNEGVVRPPAVVRSKGRGPGSSSGKKALPKQHCSCCRRPGHNRTTCQVYQKLKRMLDDENVDSEEFLDEEEVEEQLMDDYSE